jgi:methylated-DNA-[protein]-cysteine S-methyltransferase
MFYFTKYKTIFGTGAIVYKGNKVYCLFLPKSNGKIEKVVEEKYSCFLREIERREDRRILEDYFRGEPVQLNLEVDLSGYSEFEKRVFSVVKQVAYGNVITYKELAKMVQRPSAWRAVGRVLGKNRTPILIPCHRVVKSNGSIGGWSGEAGWKQRLLDLEQKGRMKENWSSR